MLNSSRGIKKNAHPKARARVYTYAYVWDQMRTSTLGRSTQSNIGS